MTKWQYYPKSDKIPDHLQNVVNLFEKHSETIDSSKFQLKSNQVLLSLRTDLQGLEYKVEQGARIADKIKVPVLFGLNGHLEKAFHVDAFQERLGTILEVEAGRAVDNFGFLKDLFEACMMHNVLYLIIAVRKTYGRHRQKDFETVVTHFDTIYASGRLKLPLKGILVIGY